MFMSLRRLTSPFFLAAALCAVVVFGCTKYAPYEGETFDCECGMLEWDGRELGMRMAEVESLGGNTYRYHIVADVRTPAELEARSEPRNLVLTLTTEINGANTNLSLNVGDPALTVQQVESPGTGVDWDMAGASLSIAVGEDAHTMVLGGLTATRGNNSIDASGEIIFYLAD